MLDALPLKQPLPLSIFCLSFQYFVFGIADLFTYVGFLSFSIQRHQKGSNPYQLASYGAPWSILVKIMNGATKNITASGCRLADNNINRNHLNFFYLFLSILILINSFVYLFVSKRYKYRPHVSTVTGGNSKE